MEVEDFLEPEIAVVAAAAAVVFSPQVRGWLRRGAVYGMAGALVAGDVMTGFARGVGRGMQQAAGAVQNTAAGAQNAQHERRDATSEGGPEQGA